MRAWLLDSRFEIDHSEPRFLAEGAAGSRGDPFSRKHRLCMITQTTTSRVVSAFEERVRVLSNDFGDTRPEEVAEFSTRVSALAKQVRALQAQRRIEEAKQLVPPVLITSRGELMAALHDLAAAIGELEASLFQLPPNKHELRKFRRKIKRIGSRQLADERYLGLHGHYDQNARRSSWQIREINRLLTYRDRRWGWIGVAVAFALGVLAIGVATMAIPTEKDKSIYCRMADRLQLDLCISSDPSPR